MAIIITNQANTIKFDLGNGEEHHLDKDNLSVKKKFGFVHVYGTGGDTVKYTKSKMKHTDVSSPIVASNTELIGTLLGYKVNTGITVGDVRVTDGVEVLAVNPDGSINVESSTAPSPGVEIGDVVIKGANGNRLNIESNNSMPVTLQDQHSPVIIVPFTHLQQSTTTSGAVAIGDQTVTLSSVTGVSNGKVLTFFNPTAVRFMIARCVGVPVGNVVSLDRLFDFAYPSGSYVDITDGNMAVDGSSTPVLFGLRNNAGTVPPPGIELTMDVTRIIFQCITEDIPELDMFGDIAGGLTKGLFCRKRDGEYNNLFNAQTNGELAGIMYDLNIYEASKQGVNGFIARLTFAGQNKMGATIRLAIDEDMEVLVQDDLSDILKFTIVAEGSIVLP